MRHALLNNSTDQIEFTASTTDDDRWASVVARDRESDSKFVYSVSTTAIYCRPSCPARLAQREHVRFHETCQAAEQAGFRACKRCKPNEASLADRHRAKIAEVCRLIENSEETPTLDELARYAGLSTYHFHRLFKTVTGVTPKSYVGAHRARRLRQSLAASNTVTDAIYDAGYNSNGRFYATSNELLGMTPSSFRRGGEGTEIRFAVAQCSLGSILVAQSQRGVCAILLGDNPDALVRNLQDEFPHSELVGGDPAFEQLVAKIVGFVEAPRQSLDLPLDIRGTAFQHRVWQILRTIPPGTTVSYADLAARIGSPKSVRAVARACASNVLAVAIPCHRVVRNDGALSGYRWGVERKRALLDRETQHKTQAETGR